MVAMPRPRFQLVLTLITLAATIVVLRGMWGTQAAYLLAAVSGGVSIIQGVAMAEKVNQTTWPALLQVFIGLSLIAVAMFGGSNALGAFGG